MLGLFGSSSLADRRELDAAGLLGGSGVRLGHMAPAGRPWPGRTENSTLRYTGDHHHLIVAGSGGGKFVSSLGLVLWDFLDQPTGSCVVVDPKGEALHKVGKLAMQPFNRHRPNEDFFVCWLDPWDLSKTGLTWSYNFLTRLSADSPQLADDARALAEAIIVGRNSRDSHWDESAKIFLTGILIYVAIHPSETKRNLSRVCEIMMLPWSSNEQVKETLQGILTAMTTMEDSSTLANGVGYQYLGMAHEERESIFSAARRDTVWIKSVPMQRVLKDDALPLNLDHVAAGRYLLFLVLPFERIRTHRAWLRLLITVLAEAFRRTPAKDNSFENRRHVFVDEWPRLQKLEVFQDEIAIARGAGVQYHLYCQSFGQIMENYRDGWEDFIANSVVQAFAVQDKMTSEYLSSLTGAQTVENPSTSWQMNGLFRFSRSTSQGYAGRPVLMPDEIRRLGTKQLIVARGLNPVLADVEVVYRDAAYTKGQDFTLSEVLDTLNEPPRDKAEESRFNWKAAK